MAASSSSATTKSGPVYFHREVEHPHGILSQWYRAPFTVEGETYISAEMWMMVQKAKLFGDDEIARQMMNSTHPGEHKRLGRRIGGFSQEKWDTHKSSIVIEGNCHKFTKGAKSAQMAKVLLETGERELVEAAPNDRIWGIGFSAQNAERTSRARWGQNLLGLALMEVRRRLRLS